MYFYIYEKLELKNGRKLVKNTSFGVAIAPIDRGHQELFIAEIAAENDTCLIILRPCFDF